MNPQAHIHRAGLRLSFSRSPLPSAPHGASGSKDTTIPPLSHSYVPPSPSALNMCARLPIINVQLLTYSLTFSQLASSPCPNTLLEHIPASPIGQKHPVTQREKLYTKAWLATPSTSSGTFDLPLRTSHFNDSYRPSVPANLQNAIFACIMDMLGGVADHYFEREHSSRKRNRSGQPPQTEGSKRAKTDQGSVPTNPSETICSSNGGVLDADVLATAPIPPVLLSLTVGINEVTKRLERLAASHRSHVETRPDQGDLLPNATPTTPLPSRLVIACRADVDPPILLAHIPNLVAMCNSARRVYGTESPQRGGTWLVPMPKGAEETLSRAMNLRRVSILLVEVCL